MILTPIPSLTPLTTEVKCIVDSIQCDTIDNNYGAQNEVYNDDWVKSGLIVLCFS